MNRGQQKFRSPKSAIRKGMLAIVILNFNGKHFLEKYLPSFIQHSGEYPIYVADNASTDDSVAFLQKNYPKVHLILLDKNTGFAGGYNLALKQIDAPFYALVNSDIEVTPNWIASPLQLLQENPTIAACQPTIRAVHQPTYFEYAGAAGGFIDYLGYPFCRGRLFDTLEEDLGQYANAQPIFWATGACMFVRAEAFWKADGFDADFFAHIEEIDLCWRMQLLGYQIYVAPQSIVYHVGGGTLHKSNPFKTYLNFRNTLSMLYKNHPSATFLPHLFLKLVLDGIAGIHFLTQGNWQDCWAIVKAHFSFYAHIGSWHSKRKIIQKTKQSADYQQFVLQKSIVFEYFIKKKKRFSELKFKP